MAEDNSKSQNTKEVSSTYGLISLILAVLSFLITYYWNYIFAFAAILLYFEQKKQGKSDLATAGLVIAIFAILYFWQNNSYFLFHII